MLSFFSYLHLVRCPYPIAVCHDPFIPFYPSPPATAVACTPRRYPRPHRLRPAIHATRISSPASNLCLSLTATTTLFLLILKTIFSICSGCPVLCSLPSLPYYVLRHCMPATPSMPLMYGTPCVGLTRTVCSPLGPPCAPASPAALP
jgi:hypothetical protein